MGALVSGGELFNIGIINHINHINWKLVLQKSYSENFPMNNFANIIKYLVFIAKKYVFIFVRSESGGINIVMQKWEKSFYSLLPLTHSPPLSSFRRSFDEVNNTSLNFFFLFLRFWFGKKLNQYFFFRFSFALGNFFVTNFFISPLLLLFLPPPRAPF